MSIVDELSVATGVQYSDEQRKILEHTGGMNILACAGSGKTTVLTHLLAKRIVNNEIPDVSKLLCTTFSKAGSVEMEERLKALLGRLGVSANVSVKTLHATYFQVLKRFGLVRGVCTNAQRAMFISQAVKESKLQLEDDDLRLVDSLLSYQVNNLLDDDSLVKSYVYTLEDVSKDKYTEIRNRYNAKKQEANVIDFDDMQLYMYMLVVQQKNPTVLSYCRNMWEYFFIDEFQDVSKIQFAILRQLIQDPNKLVVIGDDDQCLIEGTKIRTKRGLVNIEDIHANSKVISAVGYGDLAIANVDKVTKRKITDKVYVIRTENGKCLRGTGNHIGFAYKKDFDNKFDKAECNIHIRMFSSFKKNPGNTKASSLIVTTNRLDCAEMLLKHLGDYGSITCDYDKQIVKAYIPNTNIDRLGEIASNIYREMVANGISVSVRKTAYLDGCKQFEFTRFDEMEVGMQVPICLYGKKPCVISDTITSIDVEDYEGYVYDLSIPKARNFIADGIVVHNCIYQWRGADPNIILNICGYYDIQKFVLSTNYRCKGTIVNHAAVGVKNNTHRSEKDMIPFAEGGKIRICNTDAGNLYSISKKVYEHIMDLVYKQGVSPSDIAVLSRNNQHLAILNNMLFKSGIFSEASEEMKMTSMIMYKDLKMIFELAEGTYNHNLVNKILWKLVPYLGVKNSGIFSQLMYDAGCNFVDALGYCLKNFSNSYGVKFDKSLKVPEKLFNRLENRYYSVKPDSEYVLKALYNLLTEETDESKLIEGLMSAYISGTEFMYNSADKARTVCGLVEYITELIKLDGLETTKTFLSLTEQYERGNTSIPDSKITMSTMHGAKGREWEHVVIFADDNITFPSFEGINKMLDDGVDSKDISGSIDENRRLHYVAMTRAKSDLVIFCDIHNISVYTIEALGLLSAGASKNNDHIIGMAMNGEVPKDLIDKVIEKVEAEGSPYKYELKNTESFLEMQDMSEDDIEDLF